MKKQRKLLQKEAMTICLGSIIVSRTSWPHACLGLALSGGIGIDAIGLRSTGAIALEVGSLSGKEQGANVGVGEECSGTLKKAPKKDNGSV